MQAPKNSAIQITSKEIQSKPSNLIVRDDKMVITNENRIMKNSPRQSSRNNFHRSTFARSSLGNYIYNNYPQDDLDFFEQSQSLSLGKARGEAYFKYQKKANYRFPSSSFKKLEINCPIRLEYYGLNLVPFYDEKNECTGISVVADTHNSDINLYEDRRFEDCPFQLSDKITSYNSVFLNDDSVDPEEFINGLKQELASKKKLEITLSRRSNSLTRIQSPEIPALVIDSRDSSKRKRTTVNINTVMETEKEDTAATSTTIDPFMDPMERINLLGRSWNTNGDPHDDDSHRNNYHPIPLYSSTNSQHRKSLNQIDHLSGPMQPLRCTQFGSSSIRKLKNRSEGKSLSHIVSQSNSSLDLLNPLSSSRSSKKSIVKDPNSFNTREIGETIEIKLTKDTATGFGFRLVGRENLINEDQPVFVSQIILNGPADLDKRLRIGDRIIKLDDYSVKSFQACIDRLKAKGPNNHVTLVISRQKDDTDLENDTELEQDLNNNVADLNTPVPKHTDSRRNYNQIPFLIEFKETPDLEKQLGLNINWIKDAMEAERYNFKFFQPGFYISDVNPHSLVCPSPFVEDCELRPGDFLTSINNKSLTSYKTMREVREKMDQVISETKDIFRANIREAFVRHDEVDPVVLFLYFKRFKGSLLDGMKGSIRSISSPPNTKRIRDREYVSKSEINSPEEDFENLNAFVRDGLGRKSMSSKRPIGMSKEEIDIIRSELFTNENRGYRTMPSMSKMRQLRNPRRSPLDIKSPINQHLDIKDDSKSQVTNIPPPLPLRVRSPETVPYLAPSFISPNSNQGPRLPVRSKSPNPYSTPQPVKIKSPDNKKSSKTKNSVSDFVKLNNELMKNSFSSHNVNSQSTRDPSRSHSKNLSILKRSKSPHPPSLQKMHPNDYDYLNSNILKESMSFPKNMNNAMMMYSQPHSMRIREIYDPQKGLQNGYHKPATNNTYEVPFKNLRETRNLDKARPALPSRKNILSQSDNLTHSIHSANQKHQHRRRSDSKNQSLLKNSPSQQNGHEFRYISLLRKESAHHTSIPVTPSQKKKASRAII